LKQRTDELEERLRALELERSEKDGEIQKLQREHDSLKNSSEQTLKEEKLRYGRLQEIVHGREQELQRAAEVTRKLQE